MYLESIEKIRDAEKALEQKKTEIAANGQNMINNAVKAGKALLDATQNVIKEKDLSSMKEADKTAEAHRREVISSTAGECEKLEEEAMQSMDKAVAEIVRRVVNR